MSRRDHFDAGHGREEYRGASPVQDTGERSGLWHLTDNPHFQPDPEFKPDLNSISGDLIGENRPAGLFVSERPEYWMQAHGYERPYVAEIIGEPTDPPGSVMQPGRERFVQGSMRTARVLPIDEYVRETWNEPGWVEEHHAPAGTPSRGPGSLKDQLGLSKGYSGRTTADMSPEEIGQYEKRFHAWNRRADNPYRPE